jgi:ferric-dicitrate binding protein FerR (iron transport regulator)
MQEKDFDWLVERYLDGKATPLEKDLVEAHIRLLVDMNDVAVPETQLVQARLRIWNKLHEKDSQPVGNDLYPIRSVHRVHFIRRFRWIAAAVLIIAVATIWLLFSEIPQTVQAITAKSDVAAPAINRAMITLGNGQRIYLDSADRGQLASIDGVQIIKLADGQVAYSGSAKNSEIQYNLLSNPKGSRVIDIALGDGSHVWLNAESSITYPITFNGKERLVQITGEAYFEVIHNEKRPFRVKVNGEIIEDLGTKFNVNSFYKNNKTTLLEGTVRINNTILKPGQQYEAGKLSSPDTENVMSWKNGMFVFEQASIEEVMLDVARWYDVDVVYESKPTKLFGGGAPRTMSAAGLFKALEETGGVHFTIEGKKVIVKK